MNKYLVAKSYENLEQLGEEFVENSKTYILVRTKTGTEKKVRTYSEKEYRKLYPDTPVPSSPGPTTNSPKVRKILGFAEKGYITIYSGVTADNEYFFSKAPTCRYHNWFGWYTVSSEEVPNPLPTGVSALTLWWDAVGNADETLKSEEKVREVVASLIYPSDSKSQFQGVIGSALGPIEVTVRKSITTDNPFGGSSTFHLLEDPNGNEYIWNTSAKTWPIGVTKLITGKVKEHKKYKNREQTTLNYVREVAQ